jgi:uncharacterized protein YyaL (SSP411 family)
MPSPSPTGPNRLAREKSPYLLQHAHNPVDWYPWGGEAFERARLEDKPLFLSIGYSTCHWCHVMERESFEDAEVAALLNAYFVPVKVDREERPDVDRVYMTAMQALGHGGGWPLNVFLTPSLKPFWGGTYFPPRGLHGRPGMVELLPRLAEAWRDQRGQIENTGTQVFAMLDTMSRVENDARSTAEMGAAAAGFLERQHDAACGGFGGAPKFPSPGNLHFLLRRWARGVHGAETGRRMVLAQLEAMRVNGLHDHLGGGFHRYATDREWRIPHFEKMLYDQALLADAYVDAYRATGEERWAATARGVFDYVARDLCSPEGAFYSAEDADSEGEEGRFYVWTPAALRELLGEAEAGRFAAHYGVTEQGNFEHHTSVLHITREPADAESVSALADARAKLLAARAQRPRPHLDDKVITAWNGLMIAALANGARALRDPDLAQRAIRAAEFVWVRLRGARGELRRRWRDGEAAGEGQLDDHAYFAHGCLELYLATQDTLWLERASAISERMVARFWDAADGGFFDAPATGAEPAPRGDSPAEQAAADSSEHLPRLKDAFDGAELAGNSIAAEVLWRLGSMLERPAWRDLAGRALDFHARRIGGAPWAMPRMVAAMERASAAPHHLVIAGEPAAADTAALVAVYESRLRPDTDLIVVSAATRASLARVAPFAAALPQRGGRATAYLCVDHSCRQPVNEPAELAAQLDA